MGNIQPVLQVQTPWPNMFSVKRMVKMQWWCSSLFKLPWIWIWSHILDSSCIASLPSLPRFPLFHVWPLNWVADHSQWCLAQLLGGGGGGGESALNLILVRMLLVEETKPWLKLAWTIGSLLAHISGIPGDRAGPELVESPIQQWHLGADSISALPASVSFFLMPVTWWQQSIHGKI